MNVFTLTPFEASRIATEIGIQARRLSRSVAGDWNDLAALCTDGAIVADLVEGREIARTAAKRCRHFAKLGGAFGRALSAHYRALALVLFAAARWQPPAPSNPLENTPS